MNHIYRVQFLTKKGGEALWAVDLEAETARRAKTFARDRWRLSPVAIRMGGGKPAHAFDMTATRREGIEYDRFTRIPSGTGKAAAE